MKQTSRTIQQGAKTTTPAGLALLALTVSGCCGPRELEPGAGMYVRNGYSKPIRVKLTRRWFAPDQREEGPGASVTIFPGLERNPHVSLDQSIFHGVEVRDKDSSRVMLSAVIPQSVVKEAQEGAVHLLAKGDAADFIAGQDPDKEKSITDANRESNRFSQSLAIFGSLGYRAFFWHRRRTWV